MSFPFYLFKQLHRESSWPGEYHRNRSCQLQRTEEPVSSDGLTILNHMLLDDKVGQHSKLQCCGHVFNQWYNIQCSMWFYSALPSTARLLLTSSQHSISFMALSLLKATLNLLLRRSNKQLSESEQEFLKNGLCPLLQGKLSNVCVSDFRLSI